MSLKFIECFKLYSFTQLSITDLVKELEFIWPLSL